MALQKQTVPVLFSQGVDTKTDPKSVVVGKLITLENGRFISKNRIKKRPGNKQLGTSVLGSTTAITDPQGVASYKDELALFDGASLYSYDASHDTWSNRGQFASVNATQRSVIRNSYQQTAQDGVTHGSGLQCFAWEDSSGGIRYSVVDQGTGVNLVHNAVVIGTGQSPKVIALGNGFLVFYVVSGSTSLFYKRISTAAPTTLGSAVLISNALKAGSLNYDAANVGDRCFVSYNSSASTSSIETVSITTSLVLSTAKVFGFAATTCVGVFEDSLANNVVVVCYDGTNLKFTVFDYSLTTAVKTLTTVENVANVVHVTGVAIPGTTSELRVFYAVSNATPSKYVTRVVSISGYTTGSPAVLRRSVGLGGKAFAYNGSAYVVLAHSAAKLQSSYFVSDSSGNLVAKLFYGLGGGIPARSTLPQSTALSTTQFQTTCLVTDQLATVGGKVFTQTGVATVTLDFFDSANSYLSAELGDNLHISGGFLSMYDGVSPVEHGFHLFPEGVATSVTAPNTGTTNSYQYAVCYEWTDNQGQIHRSAPSPAVGQGTVNVISDSSADTRVTVTIPTLRLTAKQSTRSPVRCVVYRTEKSGTVFYQASSITSPTLNDPTADTVTFTDNVTDATLIGNPQLYTTGGVVENIAPGPASAMTVWNNRVVLLDSINPLSLPYSKQVIAGAPAEFSDLFTLNIDPRGGKATTLGTLDDKLVIFKERAIYAVFGQGPDATGGNNDFSPVQEVTTDSGCVNPRSVVQTPNGIMYQSAKGLYLLDRSLQVSYIGADVEAYNSETVTSAALIASSNQVRFTLSSGVALVFDYLFGQWSVDTGINARDSAIFQDLFVYVGPNGVIRQETPGVFTDNGAAIKLRVKSSWLQFAGIQGFQRAYRFMVLGDYITPHTLVASIAYDYDPSPTQTISVDAASLLAQEAYGDTIPYGSGVYGGVFPLYQFRLHLERQKCQAVQITLEDEQPNDIGEGLSLSAFSIEVGIKRGMAKVPAARSFG